VLVGNAGDEFICTHEYAHGDQCLSFHIDRVIAEEIAPPAFWRTACLPPLSETAVIGELAQAAAERRSSIGLDEAALLLLHRAEAAVTRKRRGLRVSERGRRRAIEAAAWIEVHCDEGIGLQAAAATCGLSAYHFLRLFTRVIGVTPHQYLIRCRIRRAAHELSVSERPVTDVAFSCGFNDLPNFTRAFRRAAETSPTAYRNFCKA
jgi:AraC-like DNA-binding protein